MRAVFHELLAGSLPIVADGAMGSLLMAQGLPPGTPSALWNIERPDAVARVHQEYLDAGARIILTNSFTANRPSLSRSGHGERVTELARAAAEIARGVADGFNAPVVVAGSMGPLGELLAPFGTMTPEQAREAFAEQAAALSTGGVDVFWVETMAALEEVQAAVEGCRAAAPGVPVVATLSFDRAGRTMMGIRPEQALETLRGIGTSAVGANCGNGPAEIEGVIRAMRAVDATLPLVAKSNAGLPRIVDGITVYDATPEGMAAHAVMVRSLGATIIGGCCGSTPAHIRAMAGALSDQS